MMRPALLASALAALLALPPAAPAEGQHAPKAGAIEAAGAWAPASAGAARAGAVYMEIRNRGAGADRLIGASSPAAAAAELHTHVATGDVVRMRRLDGVDVPAGGAVRFAPGGRHVMLIGLRRKLTAGGRLSLTLVFDKAGPVAVEVEVRARRRGH